MRAPNHPPPMWLTPVFYLCVVAALVLCLFGLTRWALLASAGGLAVVAVVAINAGRK